MQERRQKIWEPRTPDIDKSSRLAVRLGISQLVAQLLINRGIETEDVAHTYLYPEFDQLYCPFKMHGMDKAVERIHLARKRGEKVWIFGDYDADGTTAVSLLDGYIPAVPRFSGKALYSQSLQGRIRTNQKSYSEVEGAWLRSVNYC